MYPETWRQEVDGENYKRLLKYLKESWNKLRDTSYSLMDVNSPQIIFCIQFNSKETCQFFFSQADSSICI